MASGVGIPPRAAITFVIVDVPPVCELGVALGEGEGEAGKFNVIEGVTAGGIAARSGHFAAGDAVLSINGVDMTRQGEGGVAKALSAAIKGSSNVALELRKGTGAHPSRGRTDGTPTPPGSAEHRRTTSATAAGRVAFV